MKIIVCNVAGLLCPAVLSQVRPPNLSPDNLPDTAFTCEDKVTGGYYADVEADCQLFHVCVQVSEYEVRYRRLPYQPDCSILIGPAPFRLCSDWLTLWCCQLS